MLVTLRSYDIIVIVKILILLYYISQLCINTKLSKTPFVDVFHISTINTQFISFTKYILTVPMYFRRAEGGEREGGGVKKLVQMMLYAGYGCIQRTWRRAGGHVYIKSMLHADAIT